MAELLVPTDEWEIWDSSHGYRALARYVSPRALAGHGLSVSRHAAEDPRDDASVAKLSFDRLAAAGFRFTEADWTPRKQGTQPIRHPGWIASEGGNCLDLSITFAAMCLRAEVAPLLAITNGHAFVLLRPGWLTTPARDEGRPFAVAGAAEADEDDPGELKVHDPNGLARAVQSGDLIAVDCVGASLGRSFTEAQRDAVAHLYDVEYVVDVPYLQDHAAVRPLDPPLSWPSVRRYPPLPPETPELFGAQRRVADELRRLRAAGGMVVALCAESGHGKSTVARDLLTDVPNGAGWFLDASDRQALVDSLASAELLAQGSEEDTLDGAETAGLQRADREGYALAALDRLRRAATPWVVVFDNANLAPSKIEAYLPDPGPGQLVIVTTTERLWLRRGHPLELGAADASEIAEALGGDELVRLVAGRPLLMDAFSKLMAAERIEPAEVLAAAGADTDPEGPTAYWTVLRTRLSGPDRRLAAIAAHLPPDRIAPGLVERLATAPPGTVARLETRGLFMLEANGRRAHLHRLFRAAIRQDAPSDVVLTIAGDPEAVELLKAHGDRETAQRLLKALRATSPSAGYLTAAANLSEILELRGDADGCAEAYALAEPLLTDSPEDRRHRAGLLFAQARRINRTANAKPEQQRAALEQATAAHALIAKLGEPSGRYLALIGLLQRGLAQHPLPGETTAALLDRAHRTLNEAYRLRANLREDHPERIRAYFNLAGVYLRKAQVHPRRARYHLEKAEHIYADVAARRRAVFRTRHHAQIATCIQGLGYVWYYRALLVAETGAERSAYLREATARTMEALRQWEVIEAAEDEKESAKASAFLAKVALARAVHRSLDAGPSREAVNRNCTYRLVAELGSRTVEDLSRRRA